MRVLLGAVRYVPVKSDLMFSGMQMRWENAADRIAALRATINARGNFAFSKDFVLRCAIVCVGRGANYEVNDLLGFSDYRRLSAN